MQKYKDELRNKKRKKLLVKAAVFGVLVIVGIVGVSYLLFFARFIDVRSVSVEMAEELRADVGGAVENWLDEGFWQFKKRNNIVFLSGEELTSVLLGQFPKLKSVRIIKKFPHALVVSGEERKPEGVWCLFGPERCFYFDKNGVAFSKTQPSSGFLILNVADNQARELKLGEKVITGDWLANIVVAKELLTKNEINIAEFIIPVDSFDEFHAVTAEGWKIMFSNQTNVESQINALATFLKEKEKLTTSQKMNLQYIDLRIQDRIYYK